MNPDGYVAGERWTLMVKTSTDCFRTLLIRTMRPAIQQQGAPVNPSGATEGIIKGSDWYQISGGMQDWVYLATGGSQVTIELNSVKFPDLSELDLLWEQNRESKLAYIESVQTGVKGIIRGKETGDDLSGDTGTNWPASMSAEINSEKNSKGGCFIESTGI